MILFSLEIVDPRTLPASRTPSPPLQYLPLLSPSQVWEEKQRGARGQTGSSAIAPAFSLIFHFLRPCFYSVRASDSYVLCPW